MHAVIMEQVWCALDDTDAGGLTTEATVCCQVMLACLPKVSTAVNLPYRCILPDLVVISLASHA